MREERVGMLGIGTWNSCKQMALVAVAIDRAPPCLNDRLVET